MTALVQAAGRDAVLRTPLSGCGVEFFVAELLEYLAQVSCRYPVVPWEAIRFQIYDLPRVRYDCRALSVCGAPGHTEH